MSCKEDYEMSLEQENAWLKVVGTCNSIGFSFSHKKYKDLNGQDAICLFIRNLKARQKLRKQSIQRLTNKGCHAI
jgi:hypothetical protein